MSGAGRNDSGFVSNPNKHKKPTPIRTGDGFIIPGWGSFLIFIESVQAQEWRSERLVGFNKVMNAIKPMKNTSAVAANSVANMISTSSC